MISATDSKSSHGRPDPYERNIVVSIFKLKAETVTTQRASDLPDLDMVRQAIALFADPAHDVFITSFPSKKHACFSPSALDHICSFVSDTTNGRSMYFGINPVGPIEGHAKDSDVVRRRWLFIDIDRNKTLQPNDPSTDQEHEDAKELASEIATYLGEAGFPTPIMCDSGNGWHLYYRIDLPNDNASKTLVREVLAILDTTFSDIRGDVGAECYDARRLSRIPGTWSRRGEKSKMRPYRMCRLINVPTSIEVVPVELLRKLAGNDTPVKGVGALPPVIEPKDKDPFSLVAGPAGDEARRKQYAKKAIDAECLKVATASQGDRNNQLFKSAAALFQLVAGGLATSEEVQDAIYDAASRAGLESVEIVQTVESARKAGMQQPRTMPESTTTKATNTKQGEKNEDAAEILVVNASDIKIRKVEWVWHGRIPRGKLTTFAGQGGVGKTFVLNDIAARISNGDAWPDGSPGNSPAKVLYVSGEDDPEDTLVPRMIACGANLSNIAFFTPKVLGTFSLADVELLDRAVDQMGGNVLLVCVDPPTAYLGDVDDHKNTELRSAILTPLAHWASNRRLGVVFITHINKAQGAKIDAAARVIGSVAWVNGVRAAHLFVKDPDSPEERLFLSIKNNLAKERKGLKYRLESIDQNDPDSLAKIVWLGDVETLADDAVNQTPGSGKRKSAGERAAVWLIERFKEKLEWESADLFKAAKEEGISQNSVYAAKDILDLPKARVETRLGGSKVWVWWVSENWEPLNPQTKEESPDEY